MVQKILFLFSLVLVAIGATTFAQAENAPREIPSSSRDVTLSFSPLVKKISPAVVNIYTKRVVTRQVSPFAGDAFFEQFFGRDFGRSRGLSRQQIENSLGTGVVIDPDGVLITNAHVVKDAQEISIVFNNGKEYSATVSLADEDSDLAVLRLDTKGEKLPFAKLAPSEALEVGDIVLAIGNPFGVGQTVTSGIVSALARSSLNINDFNFFIQTDAAINPGNSGGPLVAMDGTVVGINTAIYSRSGGSLGIGFAIPSEMVQTVIAAEKSGAQNAGAARPWLGASGQAVTRDIASSLGLESANGVLISSIHKKSPARKAGLRVGDVVTKINDRDVKDPAELKFRLATVPIGKMADLTVSRKGRMTTLEMEAMTAPNDPPRNDTILTGNHLLNGAKVANLNPLLSVELGVDDNREGVVIIAVDPRDRTSRLIRAGDIILAVNDDEIEDIKDLRRELSQGAARGVFDITIERNGQQNRIVVR
jgi:serine protease Do